MPEITKVIYIQVTPEHFLDNCSDIELKEIDLLIQSPRYQNRIKGQQQIGFLTDKNKANGKD